MFYTFDSFPTKGIAGSQGQDAATTTTTTTLAAHNAATTTTTAAASAEDTPAPGEGSVLERWIHIFFYFSGDTATSNETTVCWVSDIKMKDQYMFNVRYNWTHFKVASNETEPAGTAAPPAPTTTTTTTTTTTEKPLEPCQCLGDPSLLNNTDNAKWGSVSRKLTLTRLFQKSACLLSQHDCSHNNRWSRPCTRTLPVSTSKRWRSHFAFWNIPATSVRIF